MIKHKHVLKGKEARIVAAGKSAVLLLIMAGALTSCGGMFSNQARCPFTDKGGCQSVSDVNNMIDEHKFTDDGRFVQQAGVVGVSDTPTPAATTTSSASTGGWNSPTPFSGEPMRSQEVNARMWVAPWQDTAHAYHGSSYVNFVVQAPHWNTLPANAITHNSYDDRG